MSQTQDVARDDAAGDRAARDAAAADDQPAPPAGRRGSLASVLRTLREAASAHDSQSQGPELPVIGPLPGQDEDR